MDWLSGIEKDPWSTRKVLHMARVLRELADVITMMGIPPQYAPDVVGQTIIIRDALENLSDDARALLKQT